MPSIKDKLKAEEHNECTVRLWPEGTFYKAYERSAYLFVKQVRPYEVRKRYVHTVGSDVISIGFPQSVLDKLDLTHAAATDGAEVLKLPAFIDEQQYLLWRDDIETDKPAAPIQAVAQSAPLQLPQGMAATDTAVVRRLREFDLANATPMQCMILVSELQTQLKQTPGR